jgi:hypothetical protein
VAGIAVRCDHGKDDEAAALIARVREEHGRSILVNNAFQVRKPIFEGKFWEYPVGLWDELMHVGCRGQRVRRRADHGPQGGA